MSGIQEMMQMLGAFDEQTMNDVRLMGMANEMNQQAVMQPIQQQQQQQQLQSGQLQQQLLQRELSQPQQDPNMKSLVDLVQGLGFTDPAMANSITQQLMQRMGMQLPQQAPETGGLPPELLQRLQEMSQEGQPQPQTR